MPRVLLTVSTWIAGFLASAWVWWARRRFQHCARPLYEPERTAFAAFFSQDTLARVRVCDVETLDLPMARIAGRFAGPTLGRLLTGAAGITLGEMVVLARIRHADASSVETRRTSILFHELVHVAQYQALGTRRFLSWYLRGWYEAGFSYVDIPAERQAYLLQDRFTAGERFDVADEIQKLVREG